MADSVAVPKTQLLRVVAAFPFEIFPVRSGGALRGYYLLRELARHFNTHAVVTSAGKEIQHAIHRELGNDIQQLQVHQLTVPKSSGLTTRLMNRIRMLEWSGSIGVSTNTVTLGTGALLQEIVRRHSPDVAVLTNLESWVCSRMLKKIAPRTTRVIDMHNVEHVLYRQYHKTDRIAGRSDTAWQKLQKLEADLHQVADAAFTCSDEDRERLSACNNEKLPCVTVPNGVACEVATFDTRLEKERNSNLLFCATLSYPPNVDGLNWFVNEIFPLVLAVHPAARLRVVGRGFKKDRFPGLCDHPSIDIVGEVESVQTEYLNAGVALCPLRMGSGTRLKILESMSFGNPVVSTSIGCEGIRAAHGESILIGDAPQTFADGINRLLCCPDEFHALRKRARRLVEETYDWRVIGDAMARQIREWYAAGGEAVS